MPESRTIFHVEDNFDNRLLVRRLLQAYGFKVVDAENAEKAIEALQSVRPDLILMDINMPDVDGYSLTSKIKALPDLANVPIIAVTANVMKGDRERTLRAGCNGYIEKPIDVDRFIDQIEEFLR